MNPKTIIHYSYLTYQNGIVREKEGKAVVINEKDNSIIAEVINPITGEKEIRAFNEGEYY